MKFLLFVKALLFSGVLLASNLEQQDDFQVWYLQHFNQTINPRFSLYVDNEYRFGADASIFYLTYIQPGIIFKLCPKLEVWSAYRYLRNLSARERRWETTHGPVIDLILRGEILGWEFADRSRIQYLVRENAPNAWEYRQRLRLWAPWTFSKGHIRPWIQDEIFIREYRGFFQNRLGFGGELFFSKKVHANPLYILRHIELGSTGKWQRQHIFQLHLAFFF